LQFFANQQPKQLYDQVSQVLVVRGLLHVSVIESLPATKLPEWNRKIF